jgi:hypothetical protein
VSTFKEFAMRMHYPVSPDAARSAAALDAFTSERGPPPTEAQERQMQELGVRRDGPDFEYHGYRYEKWSDAVAYARLGPAGAAEDEVGPSRPHRPASILTDADRTLMAALGIRFDGRNFRFGPYRYELLADAVQFARREAA